MLPYFARVCIPFQICFWRWSFENQTSNDQNTVYEGQKSLLGVSVFPSGWSQGNVNKFSVTCNATHPNSLSAGSHPIPKSHSNDFTLSGPHSPGKLKEHRLIGFRKERAWNPKTSGWRLKELPEDQGKGDGCWVSKLFPPDGSIASCVNKREHRVCIALQWTNETSVWEMRTQDTVTCQLQ